MVKRWTKQDVECWVDAHMEEAIRDLIRIVNIKSVAELEQPEVSHMERDAGMSSQRCFLWEERQDFRYGTMMDMWGVFH